MYKFGFRVLKPRTENRSFITLKCMGENLRPESIYQTTRRNFPEDCHLHFHTFYFSYILKLLKFHSTVPATLLYPCVITRHCAFATFCIFTTLNEGLNE
jgi:hypothetical protein